MVVLAVAGAALPALAAPTFHNRPLRPNNNGIYAQPPAKYYSTALPQQQQPLAYNNLQQGQVLYLNGQPCE